jgi:hypothetical protein
MRLEGRCKERSSDWTEKKETSKKQDKQEQRAGRPQPALVAGVVETLRRAVTRDRLRALTDVRALGREVGVPTVWFRGRSPLLLPEAFVRLRGGPATWALSPCRAGGGLHQLTP